MNITPLQSDFTVGEVKPDVAFRSTLEARNKGVLTATNMIPDARGPMIKRRGFRFLGIVGEAIPLTKCDPDVLTYEQQWQFSNAETNFETGPSGISMKPDGTSIIMSSGSSGGRGKGFYQFRLATPFDLNSIQTFDYPADWAEYTPLFGDAASNAPFGVYVDPTGIHVLSTDAESANTGGGGGSNSRVFYLNWATHPWEVNPLLPGDELASFLLPEGIVGTTSPAGIDASSDGRYFYVWMNQADQTIHQFEMTIPWDLNSALYVRSVQLTDLPGGYFIRGLRFDRTGERFIVSGEFDEVRFYDMATPWDISTQSFTKEVKTLQTLNPYWPQFVDDCNFLICVDLNPGQWTFERYAAG